ncbi:hypothetical protein AKJ09_05665 [Labilithrix luteola]|uniref:Uncharacterized protein n=1 Tax=Labilithrix luteola TaxID=1391654 RepID=A0A0K1Q035_9BACT|nr:hypothetical protein [Labilithrix luteola]AKU99001.1 hypothetical protein AKJ09_05665 [Labilithrix luteola]
MDRSPPEPESEEIALYVSTYYSLLRSTGEVRVRAFEEAHAYSGSSLHLGALDDVPDLSAFAYAAARLPDEMVDVQLLILGQSHELFEASGYDVRQWRMSKTRGRRRPLRYNGRDQLAVFIASASDIDDLVPIVTAYQVEWNKMHARLRRGIESEAQLTEALKNPVALATALGVTTDNAQKLIDAFGPAHLVRSGKALYERPIDLRVRMLAPSYSQYQRAAQRWWSGIEPAYVKKEEPRRPPVYFVSSNTHAIANLIGGYARSHADEIVAWARLRDPENLGDEVARAAASNDPAELAPLLYYLLRGYIHSDPGTSKMKEVRAFETSRGLVHLSEPGHIDVDAQIARLSELDHELIDPRLKIPGIERLRKSDAVLVNIDYPLGMAAYHLLSRLGQGVGEMRGVYVMGKAATLNGRVGDVMLSGNVYDEHSKNTFLFRNAFTARDVAPWLRHGSVFDNQKAVTVRSAFLQNKEYMDAFYRSGYTVLEMEAGPFLSAVYELANPRRVPSDEVVHLSAHTAFDVGIVHYASDTPYSRRQSLLSKSLSFFGVDSTYACAIAIVKRIFELECARLAE